MKYPFIGKAKLTGAKVLFFTDGCGTVLDGETYEIGNYNERFSMPAFIDITHECLQNTYGKVLSPDHAEFIIELCANNEIKTKAYPYSAMSFFFMIIEGEIYFYSDKTIPIRNKCKQITIPLPPKPEPLKNAGDNLILGCEQDFKKSRAVASDLRKDMGCSDELLAKGDEWPQVGDEVALRYKFDSKQIMHTGKLLYLSGNHIIIATDKNSDYHCHRCDWSIERPKTPEEELRDDLMDMAITAMSNKDFDLEHNCYYLVSGLMKKYNIKPQ